MEEIEIQIIPLAFDAAATNDCVNFILPSVLVVVLSFMHFIDKAGATSNPKQQRQQQQRSLARSLHHDNSVYQ